MEDSILLIIKYLLKKKNIINDDTSIDSFFSNGVSFPLFIAKIFGFPSFSGIVEKPEAEEQCQFNNNKAFQFLIQNNIKIKLLNPKFETKEDRNELLKQILIHQCFPDTPIKIKNKLNLTFESTQFQIKKLNDMLNFKTISLLLHIFTKESFPITDSLEEISQNCKKCNIPLVVNESSLEKQNAFVFLIQIQIFYDFFSSCSPKMIDSIQSKLKRKNEELQSDSENKSQSYEDTETDSESYSEESHYTPLVENLKHLHTKLNEERFKFKEKFLEIIENFKNDNPADIWYISMPNYKYVNGYLFPNGRMAYSKDAIITKTNNKKLTKLFIYNNTKKHWVFCKDAFKQLFIRLISFMISDFNRTLDFLSFFKNDLLQYEFDDEISVYAFLSDGKKTNCFLFVHVPKKQIDHPNIQSIFYQIYTFLYLICDLTFVHLSIESDEIKEYQINFVQNVINLSNLYLINMKSNGKNLFLDHSKIFFLNFAGKKTVDLNEEIIQLIKEKITKEYKISTLKTYKDLLNILFYNLFNCYHYSELYNALIHINLKFSEISEMYLNIAKNFREKMNENIGAIVEEMFKNKSTLPKYVKDRGSIISSIQKESKLYYPKYDIAFANIFEMELIDFAIKNNIFDKTTYINKLKDASESNLKYLDKTINQKSFFDENQIIILQQSHHNFLRKCFFDIIKETYDGSVSLIYENLIDILESQILEDNEKLSEMFNKYKEKNEMRNLKFTDASKKGANYVIKEVETTREIEICIDSDEDFEKIMPQDF